MGVGSTAKGESGGKSWPKKISPAAPKAARETATKKRRVPEGKRRLFDREIVEEEVFVLGRPGSDLLSQGLSHSTIGAEEFNGRVRDGDRVQAPR